MQCRLVKVFAGNVSRRNWLITLPALLGTVMANAQEPEFQGDLKELLKGPATPSCYTGWLAGMKKWAAISLGKQHG